VGKEYSGQINASAGCFWLKSLQFSISILGIRQLLRPHDELIKARGTEIMILMHKELKQKRYYWRGIKTLYRPRLISR
jgi:hypothetical protein